MISKVTESIKDSAPIILKVCVNRHFEEGNFIKKEVEECLNVVEKIMGEIEKI